MSKLTKYQPFWEKDRLWLGPVKDDVFMSHCKACQTYFDETERDIN